ncbi:hypothetical protein ACROYT_G042867 [Oculina patagonica]
MQILRVFCPCHGIFVQADRLTRLTRSIDSLHNFKARAENVASICKSFNCQCYAQAAAVLSSVGNVLKGVLNIKTVFKVVAGGLTVVSTVDVLSRWSTFDQLVTAVNSCVLPAGTNLVQLTDGCVCLTVRAETLSALTALWKLYQDGTLKTRLYNFFVTDEVRERAGGEQVEVIVTIEEQEYEKAFRELINEAQAKETEDLGRPRKGGRSYSDSNLYCKARDEQFGESEREPVLSLENKKRFMDPEKEARVQSYLQNLGDELETHSLVTESSDSGIRTHGTPSDFDKMEDVSVMSRDSKEGEESRSQRGRDDPRRRRNEDAPSCYDKSVNANYQEEEMQIPKDKVGLVIGKKGQTIKDIKERSGVHELFIKDDLVHLRGTEEQRTNAKRIIGMILRGEDSPDQGNWKKLDFIPEKYMGRVIGKNREQLNDIEQKTGATLKVFRRNTLCVKGSIESQKRAIREIKEIVSNSMRQSQSAGQRPVRFVHVDTNQLDLNHEFKLITVQLPNACNAGETNYKLKPLETPSHDMDEDSPAEFTDIDKLKEKLLAVLKKIHKENEEERVIIDIWCHLGHSYITEVDEADLDEEYFTLAEIKENLEDKNSWKLKFKGGLEKIEVEYIERGMESRTAKKEIRHDFIFYTPTCRYVRVKVWLTEKDADEQEGGEAASLAFSRAPFDVMTVSSHVLPDEQGDSKDTPCFYMCAQTQQRMKADILMASKECDYRLFIKTCPINLVARTPQAEEEDKILESYLMGMKIEGDQLVLPPVSERPGGFDLSYRRRSLRKIYEYPTEEKKFSLLVSKYQEKTVDPVETEASGFDEIATETDIHLHCKEWDELLEEGNWEPEQIVAKLPNFLQFLRNVQRNVAPQEAASDAED